MLAALRTLSLGQNRIETISPSSFDELISLTDLDLADNRLLKLEHLGKLAALTHLRVEGNRLVAIEGLARLTKLKFLNLARNSVEKITRLQAQRECLRTLMLADN